MKTNVKFDFIMSKNKFWYSVRGPGAAAFNTKKADSSIGVLLRTIADQNMMYLNHDLDRTEEHKC